MCSYSVFCLSYPGRRIHWRSAQSLHRRHTRRQEPSTRPRRCSACEEVCPPAVCCGGHTFRSRLPRQSAPPRRESQDMTPSRGWWPGIGGRRWTRPWGRRTLRCRRSPGQIWNNGWILVWGSKNKNIFFKKRPAAALPFARKRGEAACLDVYPAVSVGLILVRRTGLHLGETFISGDGVNLHPSLPGLPLWRRGLRWGGSGQKTVKKTMTSGRENTKWRGERGSLLVRRIEEQNYWPQMKLVDGLRLENPWSKEIKRNERECGLMKAAKKCFYPGTCIIQRSLQEEYRCMRVPVGSSCSSPGKDSERCSASCSSVTLVWFLIRLWFAFFKKPSHFPEGGARSSIQIHQTPHCECNYRCRLSRSSRSKRRRKKRGN